MEALFLIYIFPETNKTVLNNEVSVLSWCPQSGVRLYLKIDFPTLPYNSVREFPSSPLKYLKPVKYTPHRPLQGVPPSPPGREI